MVTLGVKPQAIDLLNFLGEDSSETALDNRLEASIAGVTVPSSASETSSGRRGLPGDQKTSSIGL